MDSSKSPGPWTVETYNPKNGLRIQYIVRNESGGRITWSHDENQARLIAAAPDLLAELEAIVSCYHVGWKDSTSFIVALADLIPDARAAIAKARGES